MDSFIELKDASYPEALRESKYPPERLFFQGDISLLRGDRSLDYARDDGLTGKGRLIAVIGTRAMSEYGRMVTESFVRELVKHNYVIVSGLARGVDRVAHESALKYGGQTIAVLAHGLQMTYPPEHNILRAKIVAFGGLILSEQEWGVGLTKQQLILRNRIVTGISHAVLVTESPKSSGTKITVSWAADQGRDVYVVPGPVTDPTYTGSVEMIREGCIPVSSPSDLIEQIKGVVS
ncbi:MAG: DNA-processing protein DprA [bacterium]